MTNASPRRLRRRAAALLFALPLVAGLAACSRVGDGNDSTDATDKGAAGEVRLGYFPNITHAGALIAVHDGYFPKELGDTKLTLQTFNAGPDAVNALLGNSLDIQFLGSNPALTAHQQSKGKQTRLVAGATSGGAQLVVREGIDSLDDLKGRSIATPQLGNTQDVAIKKWLADNDVEVGTGKDQVNVVNIANADTLSSFRTGDLDGGWLPEPWSSRLVEEVGAHVLVDEAELWGGGTFPTTVVVVRTQFLREHPQTVEAVLRGLVKATRWATDNPEDAKAAANDQLDELTGRPLDTAVLDRAFDNIELTVDPLAGTFPRLAEDAVTAGITDSAPSLDGFVDVRPLNKVLSELGLPTVDDAGLTDQ